MVNFLRSHYHTVVILMIAFIVVVVTSWSIIDSIQLKVVQDLHRGTDEYLEHVICERIRVLEQSSYGFKDSGNKPHDCSFGREGDKQ